jgi:hypothetical protein
MYLLYIITWQKYNVIWLAWEEDRNFFILSQFRSDYRWDMDWSMDLLNTFTHHLELQVITVSLLMSTLHKSPQHPLKLCQPAVSSPAISWQWLLTADILQFQMLRISLHSLLCRTRLSTSNCLIPRLAAISPGFLFTSRLSTNWVAPPVFLTTSLHEPSRKHRFQR